MSKWKFSKLVKQRISVAAFDYLIKQKNKQEKIKDIQYSELKLQDYLMEGNKNINTSKFIFKAGAKTLDIKNKKRWKYTDKCVVVVVSGKKLEVKLYLAIFLVMNYWKTQFVMRCSLVTQQLT